MQAAYEFLLARDFEQRTPSPLTPLRCINDVHLRLCWRWLSSSPLPPKVRQTLWRRWHGHLWLGPTRCVAPELTEDHEAQQHAPSCHELLVLLVLYVLGLLRKLVNGTVCAALQRHDPQRRLEALDWPASWHSGLVWPSLPGESTPALP